MSNRRWRSGQFLWSSYKTWTLTISSHFDPWRANLAINYKQTTIRSGGVEVKSWGFPPFLNSGFKVALLLNFQNRLHFFWQWKKNPCSYLYFMLKYFKVKDQCFGSQLQSCKIHLLASFWALNLISTYDSYHQKMFWTSFFALTKNTRFLNT